MPPGALYFYSRVNGRGKTHLAAWSVRRTGKPQDGTSKRKTYWSAKSTKALNNDAHATEQLKTDDWININPDGTVTTKAQLLATIDAFTFLSIEDADVAIHVYDGTAIVTGRSTRTLASPHNTIRTRHVRFMREWAKHNMQWCLVASQATDAPSKDAS